MNYKRGEWFARDWIIALLLFSGVLILLFVASTDLAVSYGNSNIVDQTFYTKYNRFQNTTDSISLMFSSTQGSGGLNPLNFGELVLQASFAVLSLILTSVGLFVTQIPGIFIDLNVPSEISTIVGAIVIGSIAVLITFIVITSSSRNKI